ncbi:MAG: barstar family protein [Clostridia bacterium]|jgi:ribonuclease inhibitor|nr:barstar family protein [Clostridia bacterium]
MRIQIDGKAFFSRQDTHRALRNALGKDNYQGSNLDALHDCLTCIFTPTEIVIKNWSYAARYLGEYADMLWHVLDDSTAENPNITVVIE